MDTVFSMILKLVLMKRFGCFKSYHFTSEFVKEIEHRFDIDFTKYAAILDLGLTEISMLYGFWLKAEGKFGCHL